jgi:molybdenum-dependent DNA-binding transcriptional regulator ModE
MTPIAEHIARITTKLSKLMRNYRALEKEHEKVRSELERRVAAEEELRARYAALEQQLAMLKASSGETDELSRKELERKLNMYIREIDRCIALLGD